RRESRRASIGASSAAMARSRAGGRRISLNARTRPRGRAGSWRRSRRAAAEEPRLLAHADRNAAALEDEAQLVMGVELVQHPAALAFHLEEPSAALVLRRLHDARP